MTRTFAVLDISPPAFNEIARKLTDAGYGHAFALDADGRPTIDMHGIAVSPDSTVKAGDAYLETQSMVSNRTKAGMVQFRFNDEVVQMDLDKARELASMLNGAIEAAVSDQLILLFLRQKVGMDESTASRALLDFRELRHGSRSLVVPS